MKKNQLISIAVLTITYSILVIIFKKNFTVADFYPVFGFIIIGISGSLALNTINKKTR